MLYKVVIRVLATLLAMTLAAPAGALAAVGFDSVDLVGPANCCCPAEATDAQSLAQLERACCCELRAPDNGVEVHFHADLKRTDFPLPFAPRLLAPTTTAGSALVVLAPPAAARAPPLRALFTQRTSLLL